MRQVLRPVCEELRKRAASRGGPQGEGAGEEEDTFVSLRTSRRTLDLKFPTVPTRYADAAAALLGAAVHACLLPVCGGVLIDTEYFFWSAGCWCECLFLLHGAFF